MSNLFCSQFLCTTLQTCSLESNGCSLDDLPCYGVNITAVLEAERETATTSEETTLTSSADDVDPDQNGSSRTPPTPFVLEGGGVVRGVVLYAIVLGVVTVGGWY